MKSLLTFPAGPRARWIVVAIWFIAMFAVFGTNIPGKFADAENNESSSYLPGDAEATRALNAQEELTGSEEAPVVIVYRREGGLTPADQARIAADVKELNAEVDGVSAPFAIGQKSRDGTAVIVTSSITATGEGEDLLDPVDQAREIASGSFDGLEVALTGPAGYAADSIKVFESINGTLFAAAFGLVFLLLILIYRSPFLLWLPLIAVGFAEIGARAVGFGLTEMGVTVNGQSSSILSVLVLGAGTDYALLLIARYREELRHTESRTDSMRVALAERRAGDPGFRLHGDCRAALPLAGRSQLDGFDGADRRDRNLHGHAGDADPAAGDARDRAALRLLAEGPEGRYRRCGRRTRTLAPARRADLAQAPDRLDRRRRCVAGDVPRTLQLRRRAHLLEQLPR